MKEVIKRFFAVLVVSTTLALLSALGISSEACTPAQVANDIKILNAVNLGCCYAEMGASVIPPGTPVEVVALDVQLACGLVDAAIPELEKIITSFESKQAALDAGSPAGATYKPAPWAVPILAAKRAAKKAP